jgi:hypothetical protein
MKVLLLLLLPLTSFSQELIERLPDSTETVGYYPKYTHRIISYVQFPGDSIEYQTIGNYVQYLPKVGHDAKIRPDLIRRRYLGNTLQKTKRKLPVLKGDTPKEVTDLRLIDWLLNNENFSEE